MVQKPAGAARWAFCLRWEGGTVQTQPRQAPKREGCKEAILALLEQHGGEMPVKELEEELRERGTLMERYVKRKNS